MREKSSEQMKLLAFITEAHEGQVRKYTGEPYVEHLLTVANAADREGISYGWEIGLCHDLFEDTGLDSYDLKDGIELIGYDRNSRLIIALGVGYLTDVYTRKDFPTKNRKERKILEAERLWRLPPEMQTIKYHDLMDNTKSIAEHDTKFAKVYLEEKEYILQGMNMGNWRTYQEVCDVLTFARFSLSIK